MNKSIWETLLQGHFRTLISSSLWKLSSRSYPKLFTQLGLERDDAKNKLKSLTLKNNALVLEIHDYNMNEIKVLNPKMEQLTKDLELQYVRVIVFEKSEAALRLQLEVLAALSFLDFILMFK